MHQSRSFCFLLGISVGAAVALLYAPRTGYRTRALIAAKAKQGKRLIEEQGEQLRDQAERGKEAILRATEGLKSTLDAGRKVFAG
jgi:gas vesicle protein